MGWMSEDSWFDSRQGQEYILFLKFPEDIFNSTHLPNQRVRGTNILALTLAF